MMIHWYYGLLAVFVAFWAGYFLCAAFTLAKEADGREDELRGKLPQDGTFGGERG